MCNFYKQKRNPTENYNLKPKLMEMNLRMLYVKHHKVLCNYNVFMGVHLIIFFLCCFFSSQYLQDESKTKRNIDLNLSEWTDYSMKPHVRDDHLCFKYSVAFTVRGIRLRRSFLPSSLTHASSGIHSPEVYCMYILRMVYFSIF